jgi:alkyl sulfatase BDS1-like metallo-beta-lactamase superfamily hydrolase
MKQVVFADPNNKDAKDLLADTYEQMGYQAESGPLCRRDGLPGPPPGLWLL